MLLGTKYFEGQASMWPSQLETDNFLKPANCTDFTLLKDNAYHYHQTDYNINEDINTLDTRQQILSAPL